MFGTVLRVAALTATYLLFLNSMKPGDIVVGVALSAVVVFAGTRLAGPGGQVPRSAGHTWRRLASVPALIGVTVWDVCRGSWVVAGHCLGLRSAAPGLVTVPFHPESPASVTAWALRVGLSPDAVVVGVDPEHGALQLHVLDASDPEAVRRTQWRMYERAQRRVFP